LQLGRRLAIFPFALRQGGQAPKAFKEEPLKSLSELADIYQHWATVNEARADGILAAQNSYAFEVREYQLERASQLMDEAASLRKRAAKLRELESGMHVVHDGYKVPQNRNQGCDRPHAIWPSNHFQ
jgi:hypothetical protein